MFLSVNPREGQSDRISYRVERWVKAGTETKESTFQDVCFQVLPGRYKDGGGQRTVTGPCGVEVLTAAVRKVADFFRKINYLADAVSTKRTMWPERPDVAC